MRKFGEEGKVGTTEAALASDSRDCIGGETAAAAVSITLRRDVVVSPAHFRVPGKKSLAEMKMAELNSEIPAAKNRGCLLPPRE